MNDTIEAVPEFHREILVADRCDRCSAQAFSRVVKVLDDKIVDLLLCGHHFAKAEKELNSTGWYIQDERKKIN